jgi:hypothetical protein
MADKNEDSGVSMSTLIHVGVEFLCAAGLVYWVNSKIGKINDLEEHSKTLAEKCNKYEEIIAQQQQIIIKHDHMISQLYSAISGKKMPQSQYPQSHMKHPRQPSDTTQENRTVKRKPKKPVGQAFDEAEEEVESTILDTEADEMLAEELAELRSGESATQFCEEGQCPVDEPPQVRNKKKLKS